MVDFTFDQMSGTLPETDKVNIARGTGSAVKYGFTGDLFRLSSGLGLEGMSDAERQDAAVFRNLLSKKALQSVFGDVAREPNLDYVYGIAELQGVPTGPYMNELVDAARFLDDDELNVFADFLGRKSSAMEQTGAGARIAGALLDPAMLIPLVGVGSKTVSATRAAQAAARTGQATRAQQFIANNPFAVGFAAEGFADLGLQTISSAVDPTGERQIDLTGVAIAGILGGGINRIVNGARPNLTGQFKPSAQQSDLAAQADELTKATEAIERRAAVKIVDGKVSGLDDTGKVAGGMTDARRLFSPLVRIYTSSVPTIAQAARRLGGVQTTQGGKVNDPFGDVELEQTRYANIELMQIDPYINGVRLELRAGGSQDDLVNSYIMSRYVRRRVAGQEPDQIDLDEVFRGEIDPASYQRSQRMLEDLYTQHGAQLKKLAENLVAAEVRGAKALTDVAEGKYLSRSYSVVFFPQVYNILGKEGMGTLFTRAIRDAQFDDIQRVIADRIARGQKKPSWYKPEKPMTADEVMVTYAKDVAAEAEKFSIQFGKGMASSINGRMTNNYFSQIDAVSIDDFTNDVIEDLLASKDFSADFKKVLEQSMGIGGSQKTGKPDMAALNSRVKLNELASVKLSDLKVSSENQAALAKILGPARMSADDSISFEDLLFNDYHQLQQGYFHQYAGAISMARRGLNREGGASVQDLIRVATNEVDAMRGKATAKQIKRAEDDLNAFIYLMHTANGKGIDYAKSKMLQRDNILNASLAQHSAFAKGIGLFRNISTSVHLGMVAFAQASEAKQLIGTVGTRLHDIDRITGVLSDISKIKNGDASSQLARDMVHIGYMHQGSMSRFEGTSVGSQMFLQEGDDLLTKAYNMSARWRERMSWYNGIKPITLGMRAVAVGRSYDRLYAGATNKGSAFSLAEMQTYFGFNDDELDALYDAIRKHAEVDKTTGAVTSLRTQVWHRSGPQAAALASKLDQGLFNFSHTIVQESGRGYAPIFMQGGLGSTLFQFMSYASNSFEKQFVPSVLLAQRGDTRAVANRVSAAALGSALGYSSRLYVRSLGMSEERRAEYLQKNLTFDKVVLGTISYMPQLSGPMIVGGIATDVMMGSLGGDSNAIRKGLPSIPAVSSFTDIVSTASIPGRYLNPEQEVTEAQLNRLLRYATGGIANTPLGVMPFNVGAALATEGNSSLETLPPRKERN